MVCAVAQPGRGVDEDDVRDFLRGRLASYKIPRHVLFFDEHDLVLTGNAKIRADELRRLAAERLGRGSHGHGLPGHGPPGRGRSRRAYDAATTGAAVPDETDPDTGPHRRVLPWEFPEVAAVAILVLVAILAAGGLATGIARAVKLGEHGLSGCGGPGHLERRLLRRAVGVPLHRRSPPRQ